MRRSRDTTLSTPTQRACAPSQARLESEGTLIVDPRSGRSSIPDDVLVDLGVMFEGTRTVAH
jgi:hypothetical protein